MTENNISKRLQCVKSMPPLQHRADGKEFDITKSEVVQWLIKQPEVLQWMFDHINAMKQHDKKLLIEFDSFTGLWKGVDHGD